MGISDMLGTKGIFVSDNALSQLNITIDQDLFDQLKKHVEEGSEEIYKCYITNVMVPKDKGVFIPPELMADALQRNIDGSDELVKKYKDGIYVDDDGKEKSIDELSKSECKAYYKKIHLPFTKKMAIRGYVRLLRGQIKNMPV
jgi:NAD+--asparagine ADP-ribosyltransferase